MKRIRRREFIGDSLAAAAALLGPRGWAASRPAESAPADARPISVSGRVLYAGEPPPCKIIDCGADPYCAKVNRGEPLREEHLVAAGDGGLRNVFVLVTRGLPENRRWPAPVEPVVLHHRRCQFVPHVFAVMAGQPLEVVNDDKVLENTHGYPRKNEPFNFNQPRKGMRKKLILTEPETFNIKCDVHPWELAWCHVTVHPFYAVTDAGGSFALRGLPPGEYELELWHEQLGTQRRKVWVRAGQTARLETVLFAPRQPAGTQAAAGLDSRPA